MSCDVGHRHGLDPALLWLWHRLATVALIQPRAWEPPCASDVALGKKKKKTQKNYELYYRFFSIIRTETTAEFTDQLRAGNMLVDQLTDMIMLADG